MKSTTPTIHCDSGEGMCGNWSVDWYEATASTVDGCRITRTRRAPGWVSNEANDFCPEHATVEADRPAAAQPVTEDECECVGFTIRTDYGTGIEHDVDRSSCPIHGAQPVTEEAGS